MSAAILSRAALVAANVLKLCTNGILGPRSRFLITLNHVIRRIRCPNSMTEPVRIRAGNGADEGIKALELEAFVNGSSNFAANGLEATLNHLSHWLVTGLFALFLLWRHDAEALWGASGSVINAWLSTVLKRFFNQERPVPNLRSDPGMPSTHAQSFFYVTTLVMLSMVEWCGLNGLTTAMGGLLFAFGSYLSWLRISQRFHTMNQVLVGALLGAIFSAVWFWSWGAVVLQALVSNLWVQILVILGGAAFCVGFILYAFRYWIMEPRLTCHLSSRTGMRSLRKGLGFIKPKIIRAC